jgi:SAM-dependent methyltransferase
MSDYEKYTIGSKNPIKRWLHRQRFCASLKYLDLHSSQSFLDYGCGDGNLSLQVQKANSDVTIVAFDPATQLCDQAKEKLKNFPSITVTSDFGSGIGLFDRVACLETIEHLPSEELEDLFSNIKSVLKEDGQCLFTFPIEHGVISLIKNCYRICTGRDKYVSLNRTFRRFFGLPVPRETPERLSDCNYIYSHIGFDCNQMIHNIRKHFIVENIHVLPLGVICLGLGNSIAVVVKKL